MLLLAKDWVTARCTGTGRAAETAKGSGNASEQAVGHASYAMRYLQIQCNYNAITLICMHYHGRGDNGNVRSGVAVHSSQVTGQHAYTMPWLTLSVKVRG